MRRLDYADTLERAAQARYAREEKFVEAVDEYISEAVAGRDDDWAMYDENRSAETLVRLCAITHDPKASNAEIAVQCRSLIDELIAAAAEDNTQSRADSGSLYEED